jgi:hypothetical protein
MMLLLFGAGLSLETTIKKTGVARWLSVSVWNPNNLWVDVFISRLIVFSFF